MSPKRASLAVGQDARAHVHSRRDRQVGRGPAAVAAICEGEPWRHCGKLGRSTEGPISTPRPAMVLRETSAAQGRIKAARCGRSEHLQFQSGCKHYEYPAQLVAFANALPLPSFRHPEAVKMTRHGNCGVDRGYSFSTLARILSRTASQDRLAAKSRLVDSRSRPKPAEPVAPSASLDGLTPGRQRSPKRSWLGSTDDPALRQDRVRRLALGALIPIVFLRKAPAGALSVPAMRRLQNQCADKRLHPRWGSGRRPLLSCRHSPGRSCPCFPRIR
jgi:hypothetical protein